MRRNPTPEEGLLWQRLRGRRLLGFRFRRQHSIDRFILDFYCSEARLAVEVDGPIHQYSREEDALRQAFLEAQGLRVLRFSNDEVLRHPERVLAQISTLLSSPSRPHPHTPSPQAERGPEGEVVTPEDVFNYAYAVFHSPSYRERYEDFLTRDFPRLPLTSDKRLFAALAEKGRELVALHLMEAPELDNFITRYPVPGSHLVERVAYQEEGQRVYLNKSQYFEGVLPEVWDFHVGGYQVCEKWLKDRKGRRLSLDDLRHYQKIVVALKETIRLMGEIDSLIPSWPLE